MVTDNTIKKIKEDTDEIKWYVKGVIPPLVHQVNAITKHLGLPDMLNTPAPFNPSFQAAIIKFAEFVCQADLRSKKLREQIRFIQKEIQKALDLSKQQAAQAPAEDKRLLPDIKRGKK